ncbi:MAG: hypothetical protein KDJ47_03675 [Hyphomicrobiaceae bacterium]|nr:hypothetical protein [Hyphomicrobiaceae bacterium]
MFAILANRSPLSVACSVRISLALGYNHRHFALAKARYDAFVADIENEPRDLPEPLSDAVKVNPANDMSAGELLRMHLQKRGLTGTSAARAIGLSLQNFGTLLGGKRPFSARVDHLLTHWLQLPPGTFLVAQAAGKADAALAEISSETDSERRPRIARPRSFYDCRSGKGMSHP